MLCKIFKIDTVDFTAYAHKMGLDFTLTPIMLTQGQYTLDGKEHYEELTQKGGYVIALNPLTETQMQAILDAYSKGTFLTIYDPRYGIDKVIQYKRSPLPVGVAMVKFGVAYRYKVGPLTFTEV